MFWRFYRDPHLAYGFRTFPLFVAIAWTVKCPGGSSVFEATYPLGIKDISHNTLIPPSLPETMTSSRRLGAPEPLTCPVPGRPLPIKATPAGSSVPQVGMALCRTWLDEMECVCFVSRVLQK